MLIVKRHSMCHPLVTWIASYALRAYKVLTSLQKGAINTALECSVHLQQQKEEFDLLCVKAISLYPHFEDIIKQVCR